MDRPPAPTRAQGIRPEAVSTRRVDTHMPSSAAAWSTLNSNGMTAGSAGVGSGAAWAVMVGSGVRLRTWTHVLIGSLFRVLDDAGVKDDYEREIHAVVLRRALADVFSS